MTAPATSALAAAPNAAGQRIDVVCTTTRPLPSGADRPPVRIVRKRLGFPMGVDDGYAVADLSDVYDTLTQPWARLERLLFRTTNTGAASGDGTIEGDVLLFYDAPQPSQYVRARLRFFVPATGIVSEDVVADGSRVDRTAAPVAGWTDHERLELFHKPGGGAEVSAGVLEIFAGNANPAIASHVDWTPAGGPTHTTEFDAYTHWKTDHTEASVPTFETRVLDGDPGVSWLVVSSVRNDDAGTVTWTITLRDRGLDPLVNYYYAAFDTVTAARLGQAVALATEDFDSARSLFLRLPGAYQRADEPDPTTPTGAPGQLRRFLQPVGNTTDLARSFAEATRDRDDVHSARLDLVPHLARMIGWSPDLTAPAETQRRDVLSAPAIFGTVGTNHNVKALVNRVTSWPCRVKEFVNNIMLTNAPESVHLWELWEVKDAGGGGGWTAPVRLTLTNDIDGRPALALDGAGRVWLFFHSDRNGVRELWRQRLDGVDASPARARAGASDDAPGFTAVDQDPAAVWDGAKIWVFWSSNREGQWDIWARTFDAAAVPSGPIRLTDHPADDLSPAVAVVPGAPATLWLFWSSRRRGPADIWARTLNLTSGVWADPVRLTTSPLRDDRPAAVVDGAGRLWLFFTRDGGGRQTIWYRTFDGVTWSADTELDTGGRVRDEGPAAVAWKGGGKGVFLLWHSDANGSWQIWGRQYDGAVWQPAAVVNPGVNGDKEPAAVVDAAAALRVVWRSQDRGTLYRSRTLDFNDATMLAELGTYFDRAHYTYDTGEGAHDWYSRGTVGLYLTPDTHDATRIAETIDRAASFVEPFRPAPVRYTWPTADLGVEETIDVGELAADAWTNAP